jgi:TusA-related sulfurtransferase
MEIASFVKNLADTHRYGIDCVIDTDNLLALALSNMPIECREPMESCNEGDELGVTLTCGQFTSVITKNPNNNIVKLKAATLTTVNIISAITKI